MTRIELQQLCKKHGLKEGNKRNIDIVKALRPFASDHTVRARSTNREPTRLVNQHKRLRVGSPDETETEIGRWLKSKGLADIVPIFAQEGLLRDWQLLERLRFDHIKAMGLSTASCIQLEIALDEKFGRQHTDPRLDIATIASSVSKIEAELSDLRISLGFLKQDIREVKTTVQKSDENITKLESEVDRMDQRPLLRTEEINSITIRLGEYLKKQAATPEEIAKARRLNRLPFIAHPF
ncbi:1289_t:CDS:2 [Paraglomus brasilianum]|uniref:1289_t:CDS:1 n=1 Tax=Paraglomus brasilianum TaxID=144538 RepID=A0A9N9F9K3_9GLOM|nr:1289_t:CDS:2 [Paraglomus brasilianum]